MKKPNPYMTDEDNPELTDEFFKHAVPARLLHPELVEAWEKRKRGERGPQRAPAKEAVSLRVDKDVLARFKATGRGWQTRMNLVLRRGAQRLKPGNSRPKQKRSSKSK
jgi:uncharacterized protein (DUF4415 family)